MNIDHLIAKLLQKRILILDGAMGTMIQRHKPDEALYRGERFKNFAHDVRGNNELLSLTQPQIISDIHEAYLAAGANGFGIGSALYASGKTAREVQLNAMKFLTVCAAI